MSVSVCVRAVACLYSSVFLELRVLIRPIFTRIFVLGLSLVAFRYVMYFRFYG